MTVKIYRSLANGEILVPPSKSYAHRLLIASALSNSVATIKNVALSKDILATISCLKSLGKDVEIIDDINNKTIIVKTKTLFKDLDDEIILDCNESGSTLRFFIPIALLTGKKVIFKGSEKLISRGIVPYELICEEQGIKIVKTNNTICFEGRLKPGSFNVVGNISSQFITGLLFALPLLDCKSIINITSDLESKNYIDITLDVLKRANINVLFKDSRFEIEGNQFYNLTKCTVEGDYSNAAFLDAFNYFGGNVLLNGLNEISYQGDKIFMEYFKILNEGYSIIDIGNCIDLGPILFCFSALKHGAKFINTSRLKIKESNRIQAVKDEIEKFGGKLIEYDNEVEIIKTNLHSPVCNLYGQNDHRIVMSLAVMSSVYGGIIEGCEAVEKSYPNFFEDLVKLGIEVQYVDIKK